MSNISDEPAALVFIQHENGGSRFLRNTGNNQIARSHIHEVFPLIEQILYFNFRHACNP
jgi:hypothetical protein